MLSVREAFSKPERGKGWLTRAYLEKNPGTFPVYSAATSGPLGYTNSFSHEGPALSWSTNGYAGNIMVLDGKFSFTADRAVVTAKVAGLNLDFCRLVLQAKFREAARGRRVDGKRNEYTKLTASLVEDIEFEVPVGEDGLFDLKAQADFVERYARIDNLQAKAREVALLLRAATIKGPTPSGHVRSVSLMDEQTFEFVRKETFWVKKDWRAIETHDEDDYPVFSAAKGPIAHVSVVTPKLIDASDAAPVVSFAVDGDSSAGGNLVLHDRPFYVSAKRSCIRSKRADVDLRFVFHSLATMRADHGFSFAYKAYAAHLADVTIEFPLLNAEQFDMVAQRRLSDRRSALLDLRNRTLAVLDRVAQARVQPEPFSG
ncbi:restriction endonuclease subunit S [Curtobacterium sp. SAFR-003]|uniref:restriction endonuclease subunit S n=1 Tax=Curtobacterium sp. SAFR-003 TaxID=3387276 RepID=UPI003F8227DA